MCICDTRGRERKRDDNHSNVEIVIIGICTLDIAETGLGFPFWGASPIYILLYYSPPNNLKSRTIFFWCTWRAFLKPSLDGLVSNHALRNNYWKYVPIQVSSPAWQYASQTRNKKAFQSNLPQLHISHKCMGNIYIIKRSDGSLRDLQWTGKCGEEVPRMWTNLNRSGKRSHGVNLPLMNRQTDRLDWKHYLPVKYVCGWYSN